MPGKNAHVAVLTGNLCFRNLLVYKQAFGSGNFELKSICHSDKLAVHLLGRLENFLDCALHVERLLR